MNPQWLWWFVIAVSVASLVFNAVARRQYLVRREPLPPSLAGNVAGGIGMILLSGFYLLGGSSPLAMASLAGAGALIAIGIAQGIAAVRRRS